MATVKQMLFTAARQCKYMQNVIFLVDIAIDDAVAWNMYGLLLERQNLDKLAATAFSRFVFQLLFVTLIRSR